jgi:pectate lyase
MRRKPLLAAVVGAALTVLLGVAGTGAAFADVFFGDTFDDGDANGWTKTGGSWSVVTDGSPAYRQASTGANAKTQAGELTWTDYTARARVKPIAFATAARSAGITARSTTLSSYYALVLTGGGAAQLQRVSNGTVTVLGAAAVGVSPGTWYTLALRVTGSTLAGSVDGVQVVRATDATFSSGRIGLVTSYASASFDDVVVETPGPGPDPTGSTPPTTPPETAGSPERPPASRR